MLKLRGFSLIELMVVVAIISLLATIAVPAYHSYLQKVKVSQARLYVDAIIKDAKQYYASHGVFPVNVGQLNLPGGSALLTPTPASLDDYLSPTLAAVELNPAQMPNCATFMITGTVSNFNGGDVLAGGDAMQVIYQLHDVDGIIIENCQYIPPFSIADPTPDASFSIPNCMSTVTAAGTAAINTYSAYINANCM